MQVSEVMHHRKSEVSGAKKQNKKALVFVMSGNTKARKIVNTNYYYDILT